MPEKSARDLMRPPLRRVGDGLGLAQLAQLLLDLDLTEAAVEDAGGRLIGVVTASDVAAADPGRAPSRSTERRGCYFFDLATPASPAALRRVARGDSSIGLGEVFRRGVYSVPEETPIRDIAEIMVDSQIRRLLVTRGSEMVGVVTADELLTLFFGALP